MSDLSSAGPGRGCEWGFLRLRPLGLNHALEHHHIDFIACGDVLLMVVQYDQAIGVGHGAEDARALVSGGADLQ